MTPSEIEQVRELGRQALIAERERCAKIADDRAAQWHREGFHHKANEAAAIAADIRRL